MQQLLYKRMEVISWVSTHADQNRELGLSTHGRSPGTLQYITQDYSHESIIIDCELRKPHNSHLIDTQWWYILL